MDTNGDRPEVFRGHLEECLKHFSRSLVSQTPGVPGQEVQIKKSLADFCGVMTSSVGRWMRGDNLPVGAELIKLKCYLDMVGYRVIEFERMPKARRYFAELIGFGVLSSEQAADLLDYTTASKIYEVLRGERGTGVDREQKMWGAWKNRKEELEQKKQQSQGLHRLDISLVQQTKTGTAKSAGRRVPTVRQEAVINIMEGLITLLEEKSFNQLSENQLTNLQETLLRLLSVLSAQLLKLEQLKGDSL